MIIRKIFNNKEFRFRVLDLFYWIPDVPWLKLIFRIKNNYWMDFKNPKTFNEKLQWLKVYDYKPEYTQMVDKYAAKEYVSKKIGSEYIIPTIGVWDKPELIEWDKLPNQYVLKTTHGGGSCGVVICNDKSKLDKNKAIMELNVSMSFTAGNSLREHPYMGVQKKVIAEKFIEVPSVSDLRDYKFFCFNGECHFFKVDFGRFVEHRANYYDTNLKLLPYGEVVCKPDPHAPVIIPDNIREMITLAEKLSAGIPFLRVDLYNVCGKIYFGELTFYPASGLSKWTDRKWDEEIGNMLVLPQNKNNNV